MFFIFFLTSLAFYKPLQNRLGKNWREIAHCEFVKVNNNTYLPALNANHPHHNIKRPTRALVGLPIGGAPSISHLPNLGPSIQEATKALEPPTKWTAPDPKIANSYRWLFWRIEQNHFPSSYQKIWRTNGLKMGALQGVISDIHRVCTNPEDPVDVRNDPSKAPILKPLVLKFFCVSLSSHFRYLLRKSHLYISFY